MTYTLKSNATTAAAIVGFVSDNGLINLIGGGAVSVVGTAAGTATGADAISTYAGHPAYGDTAPSTNFLTAEAALGIVAGEKFAVLQVGHFGATANNDVYSVDAPAGQFRFGTKYNAAGAYHVTAVPGWGGLTGGLLSAAGYAHPDPDVFRSIWGREASGAIRTYINEFPTTAATTNSTITNAVIAAGTWEFGGSVQGDAKIGIQIFMVFKGVSPDELATYLGSDPYAALFEAVTATQTTLSGPTSGQTGVASTAFTVGANGTIVGTVTITPSAGDGTFSPTSVTISSASPTATFTYTPASAGVKTISISDDGGLTDAASLTYTASSVATLTSSPLKNNTGALLTSAACEAFVSNPTTGVLVVKKTGLTSNGTTAIVNFSDALLVSATSYRVIWRTTADGAEGLETITAG